MPKSKAKKVPPKRKATKKAAKKEKIKEPRDESVKRETLVERVMREKKEHPSGGGKGSKREIARAAFCMWLMTPVRFRGESEETLRKLGIVDADTLEIAQCGTMEQFGEKYGVGHQSMWEWKKEFESTDEGKDIRAFFRPLVREGLMALYQKLLENGDAERFKTFAAYTEGWIPTIGLQHSGEITGGLSPEEQAELDRLLAKNT